MTTALKGVLRGAIVAIVIVGVWWLLTAMHLWSAYVLPPPAKVWSSAVSMARSGELAEDVLGAIQGLGGEGDTDPRGEPAVG